MPQRHAARARAKAGFLNESNRVAVAAERARLKEVRLAARETSILNVIAPEDLANDTFDEAENVSASERLLATLQRHHPEGDQYAR
jgi:hypothetical protein